MGTVRWLRGVLREMAFWATRYRRLRKIDLLIIAGSNQLSDYVGGPWSFPYTIYAWSLAARLAGTPVVFLSVGAGPIRFRLSRYFVRQALNWAVFRSYRDVGSRETVEALGVHGPYRVAPDLAHSLRFETPQAMDLPPARSRTVVINPIPYFDPRYWAKNDTSVYARYVNEIALFAAWLLERSYRVRFAPTQLRADPPVIADVMRLLGRVTASDDPANRPDPVVTTFEELLALLAEADIVIATRFHGVVLAQMLGKPTLGIAYRRSTTDLLVDVGQGAYAMDITNVTVAGLVERFRALESDREAKERIMRRLEVYRESLAAQYDLVLGLAPGGGH
jgi:polysaccharide pyruvyl transferase WcaK-like protein